MNDSDRSIGEKDFAMGAGILGFLALLAIVVEIIGLTHTHCAAAHAQRDVGMRPPTRPAFSAGRVFGGLRRTPASARAR